jgi:hypothetical protein
MSDARPRYAARVGIKHRGPKAASAAGVAPRWLLLTVLAVHAVLARGECDASSRAKFAAALQNQCPDNGDKDGGKRHGDCSSLRLRNVCIVQETFVLYDPEAADQHPNGLPSASFHVSSLHYRAICRRCSCGNASAPHVTAELTRHRNRLSPHVAAEGQAGAAAWCRPGSAAC